MTPASAIHLHTQRLNRLYTMILKENSFLQMFLAVFKTVLSDSVQFLSLACLVAFYRKSLNSTLDPINSAAAYVHAATGVFSWELISHATWICTPGGSSRSDSELQDVRDRSSEELSGSLKAMVLVSAGTYPSL